MNKIISIIAIVLAITAIVFAGLAVKKSVNVVNNIPENIPEYGSVAGPDFYSAFRVHGPFTWGGRSLATTTSSVTATTTLSGNDMATYNYFEVQNMSTKVSGITAWAGYILPATSTMISILSDIGGTRTWIFHNATSTSLSLGFAVPTGIDLVSSTAGSDWITIGEYAELTCMQIVYRNADNENIECSIRKFANED